MEQSAIKINNKSDEENEDIKGNFLLTQSRGKEDQKMRLKVGLLSVSVESHTFHNQH
jgi:hypothetical protein